ncbi:RING-H2 finger protein ATL2 [Ricinus communis]|uniref:RING-H2 finger protein ATL2 n=1 Tax=Ricinus communis TaxID=3988 RepID=UPI00201A4430|nr:RING-H2 finger protein ATL2 [Ricinus communis]
MDPASPDADNEYSTTKGYALSGKIMLSAIIILFFVVIMMVCLHLYARWYLLNARRRQHRRARNRRAHLIFYVDPSNANNVTVPSRGLDAAVLNTLPVFAYSSKTHPDPIECAVCLSEFEENERGRTLPKCNHSFHIECIDMWFHSHSTCPLCRSAVEPVPEDSVRVNSEINETGSRAGLCVTCQHEENRVDGVASTSSFNGRRKPAEFVGVTIEVPRRNGVFEDEPATESPSSYRSPMSRMLSFRRILSRERRGNASSPSSGITPASCGGGSSIDIEGTSQTHGKLGSDSVV